MIIGSNYISYKNSKIAMGVGFICGAKKNFTTTALINLEHGFISPYLFYCVEVCGNTLSFHLTPLLKFQISKHNQLLLFHIIL